MAAMTEEKFSALLLLLKASSKDVVRQLCQECFSSSTGGSSKLIDSACSSLSVTPEEAAQLVCSLHSLTRHIVYRGLSSAEEILSFFPENFHQSLKNLLTKIMLENVSVWRNAAQSSQTQTAMELLATSNKAEAGSSKANILGNTNACQSRLHCPLVFSFGARWQEQAPNWAESVVELGFHIAVSLPRLVDMDWRVDIKTSSDSIGRMAVPTCLLQLKVTLMESNPPGAIVSRWLTILQLALCGRIEDFSDKIQEDAALCGDNPVISVETVELNKETLDTMLDGLGRIRDQLSAVANK